MTELLMPQQAGAAGRLGRYTGLEERPAGLGLAELKQSKSDDLVLQSAPLEPPETMQHGISEASLQIQREACVVYEEDLAGASLLPVYFSDSETSKGSVAPPPLKITGDFGPELPSGRRTSQYLGLYDRVDPEDSIKDIISENDFYRFVLFKRHYEKYLNISRKYEEARNIAYYLEEKYHEIKAERDSLASASKELEERLCKKDDEMHEKEDELFLQLEKAIRLEEDCEKLRAEKAKILKWKDKLEKEKNEAYRQLKLQTDLSEASRRRFECDRNDAYRQMTAIVAEKDALERENTRLKEALKDIEKKSRVGRSAARGASRNVVGLEKELCDLKLVAKQSATLNSQLKKGMKHLASCRRRKCSVCAYTRSTFGEYTAAASSHARSGANLFSCFQGPFVEMKKKRSRCGTELSRCTTPEGVDYDDDGGPYCQHPGHHPRHPHHQHRFRAESSASTSRMTSSSSASGGSPPPSSPLPLAHLSYIDEASTSSSSSVSAASSDCEQEEEEDPLDCRYAATDASTTSSSAAHAFSSDSGFSSELCCEGVPTPNKSGSGGRLRRGSNWTSSFRKLIRRVSKRPSNNT